MAGSAIVVARSNRRNTRRTDCALRPPGSLETNLRFPAPAAAVLAALLAAPAVPEEAESAPVTAWVVSPLVRVFRDSEPPENPAAELHLSALRNEYESAQLAVRATAATPVSVSVSPLTLAGTDERLPADAARVRTVGYVPVKKNTPDTPAAELERKAPCEFPDPLFPHPSARLAPNVTQPFWITLRTPLEATPGLYRGSLTVATGTSALALPITVRVSPVCLPAARHLWVTNWISPNAIARSLGVAPWSEPFWDVLPAYARNLAEHRQNVILTPLELILPTRAPDGSLRFDFTRFDRWVALFTEAGVIGLIEGSHVAKRKGAWTSPTFEFLPVKAVNDKQPPPPSQANTRALLTALRNHLAEKGWLDRYVQHVADEPTRYNYRSWLKLSALVKQWVPEFRRLEAVHLPKLSGQLEIWVPQLDLLDQQRTAFEAERDQRGAELWFYTCMYPRGAYANRLLDYPLTKTRALAWLVRRLGCKGLLHWGYNFWSPNPFEDVERSNLPPGDSFIVYPGKDGPLDSIRWETLREGIEDYESLWLLDQAGAGDVADMLCKRLAEGPTTCERDPAVYSQVREAVLAEVARSRPGPASQ
jgi:hypothetical protein